MTMQPGDTLTLARDDMRYLLRLIVSEIMIINNNKGFMTFGDLSHDAEALAGEARETAHNRVVDEVEYLMRRAGMDPPAQWRLTIGNRTVTVEAPTGGEG